MNSAPSFVSHFSTAKNVRRAARRAPRAVATRAALAANLSPAVVDWIGNMAERGFLSVALLQVEVSAKEGPQGNEKGGPHEGATWVRGQGWTR